VNDVTIPSSRTTVGSYQFVNFSQITSLNLGNKITSIGMNAFYNCTGITGHLNIPNTVATINNYAFYYCCSVTSLTIGTGVTIIGDYAFAYMESIEEINYNAINAGNKTADDYVFEGVGYMSVGVVLNVGHSVTKIPAYLFYPATNNNNVLLSKIDFTGSVCNTIGAYAFARCDFIEEIYFTSALTYIGDSAFYSDNATPDVYYENSSTYFSNNVRDENGNQAIWTPQATWHYNSANNMNGLEFTYMSSSYNVDAKTTSLSGELRIPSVWNDGTNGWHKVVATSYDDGFQGNTGLTSVVIPNTIEFIADSAFDGCTSMDTIYLSGNLQIIQSAFYNCNSLEAIYYDAPMDKWWSVDFGEEGDPAEYCEDANPMRYAKSSAKFYTRDGVRTATGISYVAKSEITSPAGITEVKFNKFYKFKQLTKVTLTDNISVIGESAFYGCSGLEEIQLSANLSSIGNNAFSGCNKLEHIYYNASIINWWNVSLGGASANPMYAATVDSEFHSRDGASNTYVVVTELESPVGVTAVGAYQFYNFNQLESVKIANGVTSVGNRSFYSCDSLTSVEIASGVTEIKEYAFYSCSSLASVTIADTVTTIGTYAFAYNSAITTLTLGSGITTIGFNAFYSCSSMTNVYYNASIDSWWNVSLADQTANPMFSSVENGKFHTKSGGAYTIVTDLVSPSSLTKSTGYHFFKFRQLKSITLSNALTETGTYEFYSCSNVETITIGEGMKKFGSSSFGYTNNLTNIYYNATSANDLTSGGMFYNGGSSGSGVTLKVGPNVTSIPDYMFYQGTSTSYKLNLKVVDFRGSVCTTIGKYAFAYSNAIRDIYLPLTITTIGTYAFYNCYNSSNGKINVHYGKSSSDRASISFGTNCQIDDDSKFLWDCNEMVGYLTFTYDSSKGGFIVSGKTGFSGELVIPDLWYTAADGYHPVVWIADSAFYSYPGMTKVTIPETVTYIGLQAFASCTYLTEINIPKAVTTIGADAFSGCSGIEVVRYEGTMAEWHGVNIVTLASNPMNAANGASDATFSTRDGADGAYIAVNNYVAPEGYSSIGKNLFVNFKQFTSITIGDSASQIYENAFNNCSNVETLQIGANVVFIGENAFKDIEELADVYYFNSIDEWWYIEFVNQYSNPMSNNGAFYAWNSATQTYVYVENITSPDDISVVERYSFYGFEQLSSITLTTNVKEIGTYAFAFTGATTIDIGNGVTRIGSFAFKECAVMYLTLGSALEVVEIYAFNDSIDMVEVYYNGSIEDWWNINFLGHNSNPMQDSDYSTVFYANGTLVEHIVTPTALTTIGQYQFAGFNQLLSLTVGEGVTTIGDYAFMNCSGMTIVSLPSTLTNIGDDAFFGCEAINDVTYNSTMDNWWNVVIEERGNPMIDSTADAVFKTKDADGGYEVVRDLTAPSSLLNDKVGDYQFIGFKQIESLNLANAAQIVGSHSFAKTSITDINLNTVYYIGDGAFSECSSLTSFELNNYTEYIGSNAFYGCGFVSIDLSGYSVLRIGAYAFANNVNVEYINTGDASVIENEAFRGCTATTYVVIGEGLEMIGDYVFADLEWLKQVDFNACLLTEDEYGFSPDDGIFANSGKAPGMRINIGPFVEYIPNGFFNASDVAPIIKIVDFTGSTCSVIGDYAFNGRYVKEIYFTSAMHIIGPYAFQTLTNTVNIYYENTSDFYYEYLYDGIAAEGNNRLYTTSRWNFNSEDAINAMSFDGIGLGDFNISYFDPSYSGNFRIPSVWYYTEDDVYRFNQISSVYSNAFSNLYQVYDIFVPRGVYYSSDAFANSIFSIMTIQSGLYGDTSAFTSMSVESLNYDGTIDQLLRDEFIINSYNSMWTGVSGQVSIRNSNLVYESFSSVTIPNSITHIPNIVFAGLTQLDTVVMNDNVTHIGEATFLGTHLSNITWSQNLESIGASAFQNICSEDFTSVTIPESVRTIGGTAFYGCDYLDSVYLYNNIEFIGSMAFGWCEGLTSVYYYGTLDEWLAIEKGGDLFYASNNVTVYVRNGNVWQSLADVTSYEFAEGVTEIPDYAFKGFASLTSITIPDTVTNIGKEAFYGCVGLTNVVIPDSVETIERFAFRNCTGLTSVTIGSAVSKMDEKVFEGCPSLLNIYYNNELGSWWWNMSFGNNVTDSDPFGTTYVDGRTLYTLDDEGEYVIETDLVCPAGLTKIGSHLFNGFAQFTSLTLSSSVTEIGYNAFKFCKGLTSVIIPNSVEKIGDSAFLGCSSLVTLTIGTGVTDILFDAFTDCTSLQTVNLNAVALKNSRARTYVFRRSGSTTNGLTINVGSAVTCIPNNMFSGLSSTDSANVKIIKIARSNTDLQIGSNAFAYCTLIQEIYMSCRVSMIGDGAFAECRTDLYLDGEIEVYYDNTSSYRAQYMIMGSNNTLTNSSYCIWHYNSTW